ncbi:MAG: aldehyde dehydrogenase family protein [Actinomycetales bacterium]|nr:aldehyde dehydrogenase family protein [Actinomycetales bacterium]
MNTTPAPGTADGHGDRLERLDPGTAILYGGDRVTRVSPELAAAFRPGDRLVAVEGGVLLHIPAAEQELTSRTVADAHAAFGRLSAVGDDRISTFFLRFAERLADDGLFAPIAEANAADVESARTRGRSTTRLVLSDRMRADMIAGLRGWAEVPSGRGDVVERHEHDGWSVEQVRAGLGVVGFVFEGRPNVFADATGVLRSGNTVVFRIGSDALGTARAIMTNTLAPALAEAGLPSGAVRLLDSPSRAAGWALFSDPRLALAVARGSGTACAQLGSVARQAGTPVSLHGTGGGWVVAGEHADPARFAAAVTRSLDRKVCNTMNTCCIPASRAADLVPVFLDAVDRAAANRGTVAKLHVLEASRGDVDPERFTRTVPVERAVGVVEELQAETLAGPEELGREWEWENSPEVSLAVCADVDEAVAWFNRHSPRLVVSLVSEDDAEQDRFLAAVDAPFVGNGFTRWVDGQYALGRPELGLSNWEHGRLLGRGGVLSGDSVFTLRTRARQKDPDLHR